MAVDPKSLAGAQAGVQELIRRILFVLVALLVYRIGTHIPIPGIDPVRLRQLFEQNQGGILELFNMFSGGALERMSILALGVMPYITASIIMNLLTAMDPRLEQLRKEGEAGRRKIMQYTRYGIGSHCPGAGLGYVGRSSVPGPDLHHGPWVLFRSDRFARDRCHLHDVARRADYGAGRGQRHLYADFCRDRGGFSGGHRAKL